MATTRVSLFLQKRSAVESLGEGILRRDRVADVAAENGVGPGPPGDVMPRLAELLAGEMSSSEVYNAASSAGLIE